MPVTTVAAVALLLLRLKIVFRETVLFTDVLRKSIPTTDAPVVVPVPPAAVRFLMVLIVTAAMELAR